MTDLNDINIHLNRSGAIVRHIKGDWMEHGCINNLGRSRILEIAIVDGVAYHVQEDGYLVGMSGEAQRVTIDADGEIVISASWGFLPDNGELSRCGLENCANKEH